MSSLALLTAAALAASTQPDSIQRNSIQRNSILPFIHTSATDSHFYDEFGRVRLFHGSARVNKGFPWLFPDMATDDQVLDDIASLGFNVVRLGWMWSGYNPADGTFNETYAEESVKVINRLGERGIYSLLDMHQDIMSSKFCLYDGVPLWVVNKSTPKHAFPWPLKGNCSSRGWEANAGAEATAHAYQDLYDNTNGMLDDMAKFWAKSAEVFVDNPNVLGYELINEPFAGDYYANPAIMLPGEAGKKNLAPMYEVVAKSIREIDDRHIIFFEPVTWGMIFDGQVTGSGFTQVPGGPEYKNRSAYTFHYYCASFVQNWDSKPEETKLVCDDVIAPEIFRSAKEDVANIGGAIFMSEGLTCPDNAMDECYHVMRVLDDHFVSYTDWHLASDMPWDPTDLQKKSWARVYPRATAGQPTNVSFDPTGASHDFEFCFTPDASIKQPTEIFLGSATNYPHGAAVECGAGLVCTPSHIPPVNASHSIDYRDDVMLVTLDAAAEKDNGETCVRISGSTR